MKSRKQLTLFVSEFESKEIERIRKKFNIDQFKLIKAHITLCREDELMQFEKVMSNLKKLDFKSFFLNIGNPILFSNNDGIILPVIGNVETFISLRNEILNGVIEVPRDQKPHITIMHPRNSACTDQVFETISNLKFPTRLIFKKISLIEQTLDVPWSILEQYNLKN